MTIVVTILVTILVTTIVTTIVTILLPSVVSDHYISDIWVIASADIMALSSKALRHAL